MDRNSLILKIASRISSVQDGDTILLIEQYLTPAIQTMCKKLVSSGSPFAKHLLISPVTILSASIDTKLGLDFADLSDKDFVFEGDTLNYVALLDSSFDETARIQPANSFFALELAEAHQVPYYKLKGQELFFKVPSSGDRSGGIIINHFKYPTISQLPEELEEFLIQELASLLGMEAQRKSVENVKK